ncbi:MAG: hypothetical protein AAGH76_06365 [Pseudomonadota bacterium]
MFELDRAVRDYAHEIAGHCAASVNVAELKDHLYCLIERYQETGLDEQSAFAAAVSSLGERGDLRAAYEADLSWPQRLLRWDQRWQRRLIGRFSTRQLTTIVVLYSLLCAGLILARPTWLTWVFLVWALPTVTLCSDARIQRAEYDFLRRLFRRNPNAR